MVRKKKKTDPEGRRAEFLDFLMQYMSGLDAHTVLAGLEPILWAYENKIFGTWSEDEETINPEKTKAALGLVLRDPSVKLVLVGVKDRRITENGWLKEVCIKKDAKVPWQVDSVLTENMGMGFGTYLEHFLYKDEISKFSSRHDISSEDFHQAMTDLFGMPDGVHTLDELQSAFYRGRSMCMDVSRNIASILGVYVKLALVGNMEAVKNFHGLLAAAPHYQPIAEVKSEPKKKWLCARFEDKVVDRLPRE